MSTPESSGGSGLLAILAASVIVMVILDGVFIALASWWLLAGVLLTLILVTIGVVAAVVHVIDYGDLTPRPPRQAESEARHEAVPAGRPILGH